MAVINGHASAHKRPIYLSKLEKRFLPLGCEGQTTSNLGKPVIVDPRF